METQVINDLVQVLMLAGTVSIAALVLLIVVSK